MCRDLFKTCVLMLWYFVENIMWSSLNLKIDNTTKLQLKCDECRTLFKDTGDGKCTKCGVIHKSISMTTAHDGKTVNLQTASINCKTNMKSTELDVDISVDTQAALKTKVDQLSMKLNQVLQNLDGLHNKHASLLQKNEQLENKCKYLEERCLTLEQRVLTIVRSRFSYLTPMRKRGQITVHKQFFWRNSGSLFWKHKLRDGSIVRSSISKIDTIYANEVHVRRIYIRPKRRIYKKLSSSRCWGVALRWSKRRIVKAKVGRCHCREYVYFKFHE